MAAGLAAAGLAVALAVAVVAVRGAPPTPEMTLPMAAGAGGRSTTAAGGGEAPATGAEPVAGAESATYVHVAGAVARPGVYRVRAGGRVTDVVDAAGGPAPDADVDQLNLAARVADGERVYVPRRGEAIPASAPAGAAGAPAGPLDLNTATIDQLDALPGVGPATARAIVDWRTEHGPFTRVQDLLEVRGIGEAKLAALRPKVRV